MILRDGQRELGVTPVNAVSPPRNDVTERRSDRCRSRWECAFPNCRASAGNTQGPECDSATADRTCWHR